MARARDEIREQRIAMEAIVDAYGSSERAMALLGGSRVRAMSAANHAIRPRPIKRENGGIRQR
jgi:hypothetical protein